MTDSNDILRDVGMLIAVLSSVGNDERVNFAIHQLGQVVRHIADKNAGESDPSFHIWGDFATALRDLTEVKSHQVKENIQRERIMERLAHLAKEFEAASVKGQKHEASLIDLVNKYYSSSGAA